MKGRELIDQCDNLSYRKLEYWCQQGVLGEGHIHDGARRHREFDDEDLRVTQVLARVSNAFGLWSGGRGGFIGLYREIAKQVRAGTNPVCVTLVEGIDINVALTEPSAPAPAEPEPVAAEPVDSGFIPGVGVDRA